jgi:anti-sigma regulatory factor (Ser/Thr protein kinase)
VGDHQLWLPCDAASASHARSFVGEACQAQGVDAETAELARLVVSELVTNAVVQGCREVALSLGVASEMVAGAVTDYGGGLPRLLEAPLATEGGRGLNIVAATASAWGLRVHDEGKSVWFELPRPAPRTVRPLEELPLEELPAELRSRVMAATAHAHHRFVGRRAPSDLSGEEYEVYALAGDRFIHMTLSLRADGSVAEATETFLRNEIGDVKSVSLGQGAVEVRGDASDRRWITVPADVALILRQGAV